MYVDEYYDHNSSHEIRGVYYRMKSHTVHLNYPAGIVFVGSSTPLNLWELDIMGFICFIEYSVLGGAKNITVLGYRQDFDERILWQCFFNDAFHFGVR